MNYVKINNLLGWLCAIIATIVYIQTAERTTSWWDTGEFIASAYKLQIVHQPGAPLFLMIQNLFSNFAFGDVKQIAFWMNAGSAICSGLTVLFLFWTIAALGKKTLKDPQDVDNATNILKIMGAATVGSLAYAFTDTFWFSAVESEVYAMSSLCTAVVFWAILKWDARADQQGSERWLILIAYIMGLSIGVHLLNLLAIPAIALIIYFRRVPSVTISGLIRTLGIGMLVLAFILWGVIQYLVKAAAYTDLFFVNSLGLGFGSGVIFFITVLFSLLCYSIWYSIRAFKPLLNLVMLSICFVLLGYGSFSMIVIRATANPTLNNNDPEHAFSFLGYLAREQYTSEPLLKGPYFDSNAVGVNISSDYRKDADRYTKIDRSRSYQYDRQTYFPRIYSDRADHQSFYRGYLQIPENRNASFGDNLAFFFNYQIGQMYGRYFLWNFVGRQNDKQGQGSLTEGNWLSGISAIDQLRLGDQSNIPEAMRHDPARNTYFFLPLLIGIIGLCWHFKHHVKDASVVALLFLFTGIAIVVYLNQTPLQPRERDYAYAGSFYAFAVWIGLGVYALSEVLSTRMKQGYAGVIAIVVGILACPAVLIAQNWDDHNRSDKFVARDIARNYLETCEPNAILFTYGDNDTFPIWYLQEVEGFRRDVRVVVLSYLTSDWYMRQSTQKVYEADGLPLEIDEGKFVKGKREALPVHDLNIPHHADLNLILDFLVSEEPENKLTLSNGEYENFLPTKKLRLDINKEEVLKSNTVPKKWISYIPERMEWEYNKDFVSRAEVSLFALLAHNNWKRPVYFSTDIPSESLAGLDKFMVSEGFANKLMPIQIGDRSQDQMLVDADALYRNIKEKYVWGNLKKAHYVDADSFRFVPRYLSEIFTPAASGLLAQGENEKAREVALTAYRVMPDRVNSMYDVYHYSGIIDTLYKTGQSREANQLVDRNVKYLQEHMDYYARLTADKPAAGLEARNIRLGLASLTYYESLLANTSEHDRYHQVSTLNRKYTDQYDMD